MRKGFSLLEVIIVVAIASTIVLVVANLGSNTNLLNNLVSQELQSKSDISQTLQIMTTAIRSASPSASGAYPIISAATSSFIFYSDTDGDGIVERVRYFLASSSIKEGLVQPTGTPATYPTSSEVVTDIIDSLVLSTSTPLFSYYNLNYTGSQPAMTSTVDVSTIRLVKIAFSADTKPQQSPGPQYFSAFIDIRNLRSN
jgi:prepilin-type N-terminal cleavage/methylation domain-containing protein